MRRFCIVCAGSLLLSVSGCAEKKVVLGDPAVYARIEATKSCEELQRFRDQAEGLFRRAQALGAGHELEQRIQLSYLTACETRYEKLGCLGRLMFR